MLFGVLLRLVPAMGSYSGHLIICTHNAHSQTPAAQHKQHIKHGVVDWMRMKPLKIDSAIQAGKRRMV